MYHLALDSFAIKIDLSQAYYHLPFHENHKKYFTFAFGKKKYQFQNLIFGLSSAPYFFTTVMVSVIAYIRKE